MSVPSDFETFVVEYSIFDDHDDENICQLSPGKLLIKISSEGHSMELTLQNQSTVFHQFCDLTNTPTLIRVHPLSQQSLLMVPALKSSQSYAIRFPTPQDMKRAQQLILKFTEDPSTSPASVFDQRTEVTSAKQYFQFYALLSQQQNMLQDFVRTHTYQHATHLNSIDFRDKVVLDVGAGSGILSYFAIQAGARHVYAVEASNVAEFCEHLVAANNLSDKITVVKGKIEDISLPEPVDVLISEPMGYMLFNERMLESYIHARKFLRPQSGLAKMFPSLAHLYIAPFTDEALFQEMQAKATFWNQTNFYGVNLNALSQSANVENMSQPVVDTFDMSLCMARAHCHIVDFRTAAESDLHTIVIPLRFSLLASGMLHGLAFWFDVAFIGTRKTVWLSTAPSEPLTHWYQVRCLFHSPLYAQEGDVVEGECRLTCNEKQSYEVFIQLGIPGTRTTVSNTLDLKNPCFRYTAGTATTTVADTTQQQQQQTGTQITAHGGMHPVNKVESVGQQQTMPSSNNPFSYA